MQHVGETSEWEFAELSFLFKLELNSIGVELPPKVLLYSHMIHSNSKRRSRVPNHPVAFSVRSLHVLPAWVLPPTVQQPALDCHQLVRSPSSDPLRLSGIEYDCVTDTISKN